MALSDIMISLEGSELRRPALSNPLQHGVDRGMVTPAIRYASKSILSGSSLILWSGRIVCARHVASVLFSEHNAPSEKIIERLHDIDEKYFDHAQIIYCHSSRGKIKIDSRNCKRRKSNGVTSILGGRGAVDLMISQFGAARHRSGKREPEPAHKEMLARFGEVIHRELTDPFHHDDAYGAGYELIFVDPNVGFYKQSYSLDFFEVLPDGELGHIARSYYQYVGNVLYIISLTSDGVDEEGNYIHRLSATYLTDILQSVEGARKFSLLDLRPMQHYSYVKQRGRKRFSFIRGYNGMDFTFSDSASPFVTIKEYYFKWQEGLLRT